MLLLISITKLKITKIDVDWLSNSNVFLKQEYFLVKQLDNNFIIPDVFMVEVILNFKVVEILQMVIQFIYVFKSVEVQMI